MHVKIRLEKKHHKIYITSVPGAAVLNIFALLAEFNQSFARQ